ncbi:MAG: hypothetical protein ACJAYF_002481 [Arenicella sp.]|jgi:hypothetical protein
MIICFNRKVARWLKSTITLGVLGVFCLGHHEITFANEKAENLTISGVLSYLLSEEPVPQDPAPQIFLRFNSNSFTHVLSVVVRDDKNNFDIVIEEYLTSDSVNLHYEPPKLISSSRGNSLNSRIIRVNSTNNRLRPIGFYFVVSATDSDGNFSQKTINGFVD